MNIIGHITTDFPTKFGIPRQSGLVEELKGVITFEPEYRHFEAFRGLEEFSYIWILWEFSKNHKKTWSATVTPPRLGGKVRMGVFATRAPFRPNNIGLSCVRLDHIEYTDDKGPLLYVSGVDMADGTPIYDIKPYIKFTDAHLEAKDGFTADTFNKNLKVIFPSELLAAMPENKQAAAIKILEQDPRPAYDSDETRAYGVTFANFDIRFKVSGDVLTVFEVVDLNSSDNYRKVK